MLAIDHVTKPRRVRTTRHILRAASLSTLLLNLWAASAAMAQDDANQQPSADEQPHVSSDLLIVLDTDGRSHTVQHTVASNGPSLSLRLPGSIVPQEVLFFGADREQLTEQYKSQPSIIKLTTGSAFARYQHQYGIEVQQLSTDQFVLTTPSVPANVVVDNHKLSHSGITWVFPNEYKLISYTITNSNTGRWVAQNNILTFHHSGSDPVELSINYKRNNAQTTSSELACSNASLPNDECSEDKDEDGIPDYRDICVGKIGQTSNLFGCKPSQSMLLSDVEFAIGRTYLDVRARNLLDKVAYALLRHKGRYFEIGTHTDNAGAAANNHTLSQKRADAVRHYLMLRGVDPNIIRATGYGEKYPIRDNASQEGRRANRRVELVLLE